VGLPFPWFSLVIGYYHVCHHVLELSLIGSQLLSSTTTISRCSVSPELFFVCLLFFFQVVPLGWHIKWVCRTLLLLFIYSTLYATYGPTCPSTPSARCTSFEKIQNLMGLGDQADVSYENQRVCSWTNCMLTRVSCPCQLVMSTRHLLSLEHFTMLIFKPSRLSFMSPLPHGAILLVTRVTQIFPLWPLENTESSYHISFYLYYHIMLTSSRSPLRREKKGLGPYVLDLISFSNFKHKTTIFYLFTLMWLPCWLDCLSIGLATVPLHHSIPTLNHSRLHPLHEPYFFWDSLPRLIFHIWPTIFVCCQ